MTTDYPVDVEVVSPPQFQRVQVVLRIALAIVLGWLGVTAGWLIWLLFGALPVIAAISISSIGATRFHAETAPRLWRALDWLLQFSAFMAMIVDQLPVGGGEPVRTQIRFTGTPTVGSALTRLVTSIPSGFVLALLWFVAGVLWMLGALLVLVSGHLPESLISFQRGVLRWNARLVAYHASLIEEYPPFSFDTGGGRRANLAASQPMRT